MTTEHPNIGRIRRALRLEGGLFEWEDILEALKVGDMQSFTDGDSLILTRIAVYPRKKVLEIILVFGSLDQVHAIEPRLIEFAKTHECVAVLAMGRLGWEGAMTPGWRRVFSYYIKELDQ